MARKSADPTHTDVQVEHALQVGVIGISGFACHRRLVENLHHRKVENQLKSVRPLLIERWDQLGPLQDTWCEQPMS